VASHILFLVELHGASFAEVSFYLKSEHRLSVSRQRIHAYYQRITMMIDTELVSTNQVTFRLPCYREALQAIRALRKRRFWRLRSPLLLHLEEITGLHEASFYSFKEIAQYLNDLYDIEISRQALHNFYHRHNAYRDSTEPLVDWGEVGV
jgi:hypothetical protein